MLVGDEVLYISTIFLNVIFTFFAILLPTRFIGNFAQGGVRAMQTQPIRPAPQSGGGFGIGKIALFLRATFFPYIASIGWGALGYFTFLLNNCSGAFGACFTNPTLSVTTGTITVDPFSGMGAIYWGICLVLLAYAGIITLMVVRTIATGGQVIE